MRKLFVVLAVVGLTGGLLAVTSTTGSAEGPCPTILVHTPNPPPSPGVNWSGCDLTQVNLAGGNLTGAVLNGAILNRANLTGANLTGASLRGADLTGATLTNATLDHVDADRADFFNAKATSTSMVGIALSDASLRGADLTGANLADAFMWGVDLEGSKLAGATLAGVSAGLVTGTPTSLPSPWKLINGYLIGPAANLADAELVSANLTNVDLTGANLTNAILTSATLTNATLINANLSGATVTTAILQGAKLAGATLTGIISGGIGGNPASLSSPWTIQVGYLIGPGANLFAADLANANLAGADLTGADLTHVRSGNITGTPVALPDANWHLKIGYLWGPDADLIGITMRDHTSLAGFNLSGASISWSGESWYVEFGDSDLTGAYLAFTCRACGFERANLARADIHSAWPDGLFGGVHSGGIHGSLTFEASSAYKLRGGFIVGPGVDFTDDSLYFVDLTGIDLHNSIFTGADLSGTNFHQNVLDGVVSGGITGVPVNLDAPWSLRSGYLVGPGANLHGATFDGANLAGITANAANLTQAHLSGANLTGATLRQADLTAATLTGATISGADLSDATLTGVVSGGLIGQPTALTLGWAVQNGYIVFLASLPGPPGTVTATAGDKQATVTWTADSAPGGSPITGYVVTPYIGATPQTDVPFSSTATTQKITGLTNGTAYTFKVAATNTGGTGPQSAASNEVTPVVPVTGLLRVVTSPALASQIKVDGDITDTWALSWMKIPVGSHTVCFSQVPGYSAPGCQTVAVTKDVTTTVTGAFTARGYLHVTTSPSVPSQIKVDGIARNSYGMWTDIPTGSHQVCFGAVAGFTPPACQTVNVTAGTTTTVNGAFAASSAAGQTGMGFLRATTSPAVPSQITVDGNITDTWGLNWMEIAPGAHTVCFGHVENYTEPACQSITVTAGATSTVPGTFVQRGFLRVATNPAVPGTITINGTAADDWGVYTDIEPGTYHVCFGAVTGKTAPACQDPVVTEGTLTAITGTYT